MAAVKPKKLEPESAAEDAQVTPPVTPPQEPPPPTATSPIKDLPVSVDDAPKDVAEEKSLVPLPLENLDESKAIVAPEKVPESSEKKPFEGSINRDAVLARVETEKRTALIRAWEESEKSKAENKAHKRISAVDAWENSKKASVEADLKKIEEKLEKKKAEYVEIMNNKIAMIHKEAEEKKAMVEAKLGEEILKAEEMAAKYRATGTTPKKLFGFLKK
ncbi:hypothetical protein Nepgr_031409 [Nepenthes gracilis]|uniref:Remorin n=1 Tax=Nepenthes gracilis TaxID=150966 RepID=A0AAD3Y7H5_NEPGR|nr:hypothetical protein Nepgr_031409 [Nepenthes gracilis]